MDTRRTICMLALALALVAMALSASRGATAVAATTAHDPFTVRMKGGDGIAVELRGNAHGYRAGEEARFELALSNDSGDVWQGRYCLVLVDRSAPVATLAGEEFSLRPTASEARTVEARLPEGLAEGCYGLALVVPGRLASATTITVGEGACSGPWPAPACL